MSIEATTSPATIQPYFSYKSLTVYHGDCRDVLPMLASNSVDSIVTDPPYEISFMNRKWDSTGIAFNVAMWGECLRVLKPGGHLLAFGGTRTHHRMVCAIEDAGFEIRDEMEWIYASGFPKSVDIGKAIDRELGAERQEVATRKRGQSRPNSGGIQKGNGTVRGGYNFGEEFADTLPATPEAQQWDGWGTALKPAQEPICLARKPLEGTVAENVLKRGVGGLNIDRCRIGTDEALRGGNGRLLSHTRDGKADPEENGYEQNAQGRWPANVLFDEVAAAMLDEQSGNLASGKRGILRRGATTGTSIGGRGVYRETAPQESMAGYGDSGGASRFFYVAKASRSERGDYNDHPTVKPVELMRYLCRLVTPPGGLVLDPFVGSGSTLVGCWHEGFRSAGIELSESTCAVAAKSIKDAVLGGK